MSLTFNWTEGRRLESLTYHPESETEEDRTTSYQYNDAGLRTKKTNADGTYTVYHIADGRYVGETRFNANGTPNLYIRYTYDENDSVVGISLWHEYEDGSGVWVDYYFVKNLQGDVLQVYNENGNSLVASYSYDAWGNVLSATGSLATINPFRYRGYYFDNETYFYYLQSRYYDPAIGRFVNADNQVSTVGGNINDYNLYSYCANNPVNRIDPDGHAWKDVKNWFSNTWKKVVNSIKKPINESAEKHYSRNSKNKVNDSVDTIMEDYTKVSEWADQYHENTSGSQGSQAKYNDKYLSPNGGHYEVIICNAPNIEPYIVDEFVDVSNMGTYNYAANDSFVLKYYIEHLIKDMVPYYLFGNTRDDNEGYLKWALD